MGQRTTSTKRKAPIGIAAQAQAQAIEKNRRNDVLRLRGLGWSYSKIADELGYADSTGPWKLMRTIRDEQTSAVNETAPEVLALELERLDEVLVVAWEIANDKRTPSAIRLQALDRVIKTMDRRARYLGLDSPDKVEVTEHGALDAEIERLLRELAGNDPAGEAVGSADAPGTSVGAAVRETEAVPST